MTNYIVRRLLVTIPVIFGVTLLTFIFITLMPGDPVLSMFTDEEMQYITDEWLDAKRAQYGLDKPIPVRYAVWMKEILTGNLGRSYFLGLPVSELMAQRLPRTLQLSVLALVLSTLLGIVIGTLAGLYQYSPFDHAVTFWAFAGASVPSFFVALVAVYLFALKWQLLPAAGMYTLGTEPTLADRLRHMILPLAVLSIHGAAPLTRYARSCILEVIHADYVRTARAKGLSERVVIVRHAFRNGLLPIITVIGLGVPGLFGGSIIIEQIFLWPGMGTLSISAVMSHDYPVVMGINLVFATIVLLTNLLVDMCYAAADPRIRYS